MKRFLFAFFIPIIPIAIMAIGAAILFAPAILLFQVFGKVGIFIGVAITLGLISVAIEYIP